MEEKVHNSPYSQSIITVTLVRVYCLPYPILLAQHDHSNKFWKFKLFRYRLKDFPLFVQYITQSWLLDYNGAENRNLEQTLSYTRGLLWISVLTSAWGYLCVVLLVATCLGGDQPQLSLPHPHICQGGGSGAKNLDNCGELHSGNDSLYCLNQWQQQLCPSMPSIQFKKRQYMSNWPGFFLE